MREAVIHPSGTLPARVAATNRPVSLPPGSYTNQGTAISPPEVGAGGCNGRMTHLQGTIHIVGCDAYRGSTNYSEWALPMRKTIQLTIAVLVLYVLLALTTNPVC